MSAAAIPYWELPASWGTATTATIDVAGPEEEAEEMRDGRQQMVFVVAPHQESVYSESREHALYGTRGISQAYCVFLVEAPVSLSSFRSVAETFTADGAERSRWRGFFPIPATRRLLFSMTLELQTTKLPRLKPRVSFDRRTLEREDA